MSDVKWIKLSVQMFDDEKIRLIEALPESDSILIIFIKLLALAGKTNSRGEIYLSENLPYTDEMLAHIFHRKLGTVRMALQTFERFGMIELTENRTILIKNWGKHQNISGMERVRAGNRERQKKLREQKKNTRALMDEGKTHVIVTLPVTVPVTLPSREERDRAGNRAGNRERQKKLREQKKNTRSLVDEGKSNVTVTLPVTLPSRDITQQSKRESGNVTCHVTLDKKEEPPTVPQGGLADAVDSLIREFQIAKRLICKLVLNGKNPDRAWSYEAMEALTRQLPIPRKEIELVGKFHRVPDDDQVIELRSRRRSESTLMPFWSDEVTRATAYFKKMGTAFGPRSVKKNPMGWRDFFRWKYGDECRLPADFESLGADQLKEWEEGHAEFERSKEVSA